MNRYSIKESDFKSDVSTNFTKQADEKTLLFLIPQFDILTIGAQIFGLLVSLYFFYYYSITTTIPYFIEIKKFRAKKLNKTTKSIKNIETDLNNNLWLINYSYKNFLK